MLLVAEWPGCFLCYLRALTPSCHVKLGLEINGSRTLALSFFS